MHKPALLFCLAFFIPLMVLVACAKDPQSSTTTGNFEIDKLFVYEGCTMYRFGDAGNYHYFAKCGNSVDVESNWDESCGKGCTTHKTDNIRIE